MTGSGIVREVPEFVVACSSRAALNPARSEKKGLAATGRRKARRPRRRVLTLVSADQFGHGLGVAVEGALELALARAWRQVRVGVEGVEAEGVAVAAVAGRRARPPVAEPCPNPPTCAAAASPSSDTAGGDAAPAPVSGTESDSAPAG
jgi:hypothetical protein